MDTQTYNETGEIWYERVYGVLCSKNTKGAAIYREEVTESLAHKESIR